MTVERPSTPKYSAHYRRPARNSVKWILLAAVALALFSVLISTFRHF